MKTTFTFLFLPFSVRALIWGLAATAFVIALYTVIAGYYHYLTAPDYYGVLSAFDYANWGKRFKEDVLFLNGCFLFIGVLLTVGGTISDGVDLENEKRT